VRCGPRLDHDDVELRARRCPGAERRREAEVEAAVDQREGATVSGDRRRDPEQVGGDDVDDLATCQTRRELHSGQGVGEVLHHPDGAALELQAVHGACGDLWTQSQIRCPTGAK
jgi:hypothetical protein